MRVWPAALIATLAAAVLVWTWTLYDVHRQGRVLASFFVLLGALTLLLLWLLIGSRLRWRIRLLGLATVVVLLLLAGLSLRLRGVSGDLIPVLEWRWTASASVPTGSPAPAGDGPLGPPGAPPRHYPQFLGPRRDATVETRLDPDWSSRPPRLLWREPIGEGWSAFAVQGEVAVTQEQWGPRECVAALGLTTGRRLWSHCDAARFDNPLGGPGPRATPTLQGDRVYALGATGMLNALELTTGRRLWSRDVIEDNQSRVPVYGVSASPLVYDDVVVVLAGGADGRSLVAYDRTTGERRWAAGDDPAAYSSPLLAELGGRRQVVVLNEQNLTGHDATDGTVLWSFPWAGQTERVSQPVLVPGDRLFASTGYGIGGRLVQVESEGDGELGVRELWENRRFEAKFTNVVRRADHLFGLDDGILACLDLEDGRQKWKRGRYGHGQVILAGDLLLIQAENGDVGLVEANPERFRQLARIPVLRGKTWNHPALAGPYLLVRNDKEAACLELPLL